MKRANRIKGLSSAIFYEMGLLKDEVEKKGTKVINLSIGSPDRPPAPHIIEALHKGIDNFYNYRYPVTGSLELCKAMADFYHRRFNVELDPEKEVLVLMGSQDGLAHLAMAYIDPGDLALVPDPGYPIYSASIILSGGQVHAMPLRAENKFLPDLKVIPKDVAQKAKLMWLNYPNNPVAASADRDFFEEVVAFAKENKIMVCHDVAYSELAYDGFKPMSFLEIPGAKEIGVEFHSLSKTYNMAGCRIGFALGNAEVLDALNVVKSNIDYGVFLPLQDAGVAALNGPQDCVAENALTYQRRRDTLVDGLADSGWVIEKPKASMFVWAPLPNGYKMSKKFSVELLHNTGVLVTPGIAFGKLGEGYVRIALVQKEKLIKEAVERINAFLKG